MRMRDRSSLHQLQSLTMENLPVHRLIQIITEMLAISHLTVFLRKPTAETVPLCLWKQTVVALSTQATRNRLYIRQNSFLSKR